MRIYDQNENLAALMGANKDYILNHIPHISKLLTNTIDEVLAHANTIVIGNGDKEFNALQNKINSNQIIIDLVRLSEHESTEGRYRGICW